MALKWLVDTSTTGISPVRRACVVIVHKAAQHFAMVSNACSKTNDNSSLAPFDAYRIGTALCATNSGKFAAAITMLYGVKRATGCRRLPCFPDFRLLVFH